MSRAIIFNGTNQYTKVTLPNAAPWNALGAHKAVVRMRDWPTTGGGGIALMEGGNVVGGISLSFVNNPSVLRLSASRDGVTVDLSLPTGLQDIIVKMQYDPANSRYTLERWNPDGGDHVSVTVAAGSTANFNFGTDDLSLGAAPWGGGPAAIKEDWAYWQSGADALGVFPGAEPAGGTYLALYTFELDTPDDTSGNALHMTPYGGALYSYTPTGGGRPLAPVITVVAGNGQMTISGSSAGATSYKIFRRLIRGTYDYNAPIATPASLPYIDTTAVNDQKHFYEVRAVNGVGDSASSVERGAHYHTTTLIDTENALTGTSSWQLSNPAAAREIEGYTSKDAVEKGSTVEFHISSSQANYTIDIYRMGYYQGLGGRQIGSQIAKTNGSVQSMPTAETAGSDPTIFSTDMVECNWTSKHTYTVPSDAVSGIYLAKMTQTTSGKQSYMIFCVTDSSRTAKVLYVQPTTTYHAYNNWGGKSAYTIGQVAGQGTSDPLYGIVFNHNSAARKHSFNRPYAVTLRSTKPKQLQGIGAGDFLTQNDDARTTSSASGWELDLIMAMEMRGVDVKYCTNTTQDASAAQLTGARCVMYPSHNEYWTLAMRDNAIAALEAGVHIFNAGANAAYWQVKFENDAAGNPRRRMVAWKEAVQLEPGTDVNLKTALWRYDPNLPTRTGRPEEAFLGTMWQGYNVDNPLKVGTNVAGAWIFRGLDIGARENLGNGLVGYEYDKVFNEAGSSPSGLIKVFTDFFGGAGDYFDGTLFTHASGATVFSTGTNNFTWGIYTNPLVVAQSLHTSLEQTKVKALFENILDGQTAPASGGGGGGSAPAAPVISGTAGNAQVILDWPDVSGADGYELEMSSGGGAFSNIYTGATSGYTKTALANGTAYSFRVRATNATGNSGYSYTIIRTPASGGGGGTNNVNFVVSNPTDLTLTGTNSLEKTGGASNNDFPTDRAVSQETIAAVGDKFTFTIPQANKLIYVGIDPSTSAILYTGFDIRITFDTNGTMFWASAGGGYGGDTTYAANDVFHLELVDVGGTTRLRLLKGTTTLHTFTSDSIAVAQFLHVNFGTLNGKLTNATHTTPVTGGGGTPPATAPTLSGTAGDSQVVFDWNDITDATSYQLEMLVNSVWAVIYAGATSAYTKTGLVNGTSYSFRVRAENVSGESEYSSVISRTPEGSGTPPSAPSGLNVSTASNSALNLSWTDNSSDESGFRIEESANGSSGWSEIATVGSGITTYPRTGLAAGVTRYYRVRAYNGAGNSGYSNNGSGTTSGGGGGGGGQTPTSVTLNSYVGSVPSSGSGSSIGLITTTLQWMFGTRSLQITANAAGSGYVRSHIGTAGIRVNPNTVYSASGYFRAATTSRNCRLQIWWYDASGTPISTSYADNGGLSDNVSGWIRVKGNATSPSNAHYATMVFGIESMSLGEIHYADGIQLEDGDIPTAYSPQPSEITPGIIGTTHIADDSITTAKIVAFAITANRIAANAITAEKIVAGSITADRLAANTITAAQIEAATITANEIASNTIVAGNIAAGAITADKIAANAITAAKIAANTITASKIAANTITANEIAVGTIIALNIASNTITANQIAANTITAAQIAAGTITASRIAAGTITANEIAANTITAAKILAGTITATELAASSVVATKIAADAVTAEKIAAGSITAVKIASRVITADLIALGTLTGSELADGIITDGKVASTASFVRNAMSKVQSPMTGGGTISFSAANVFSWTERFLILPTPLSADGFFQFTASSVTIPNDNALYYRTVIGGNNGVANTNNIIPAATTSGWFVAPYTSLAGLTTPAGFTDWLIATKNSDSGVLFLFDGRQIKPGQTIDNANFVPNGSIVANFMAANAITAGAIAADAVIAGKVAANAITAREIAANSITADKIIAGAITADKISSAVGTFGTVFTSQLVSNDYSRHELATLHTEQCQWPLRLNTAQDSDGGVIKNTTGAAWNAGAASSRALYYGSGHVEFTVPLILPDPDYYMIGFTYKFTTGSFTGIHYAWYIRREGNSYLASPYEDGSPPAGNFAFLPGDTFKVAIEGSGTSVNYYINGASKYSHSVTPQYPLRVQVSVHQTTSPAPPVFLYGLVCDAVLSAPQVNLTHADNPSTNGGATPLLSSDGTFLYVAPTANMSMKALEVLSAGEGFIEFQTPYANASKAGWLVGFLPAGTTGAVAYTQLTHAIHHSTDNTASQATVYESGNPFNTYQYSPDGETYRIGIENGSVVYRRNGLIIRTSNVAISYPVRPCIFQFASTDAYVPVPYFSKFGTEGSGWRLHARQGRNLSGMGEFNDGMSIRNQPLTEGILRALGSINKQGLLRGRDRNIVTAVEDIGLSDYKRFSENDDVWVALYVNTSSLNLDTANADSTDHVRVKVHNKFGEVIKTSQYPWNRRGLCAWGFHTRDNADPLEEAVYSLEIHNSYGYSKPFWFSTANFLQDSFYNTGWVNKSQTPPAKWVRRSDCPTDLQAVAVSDSVVNLTWQASATTSGTNQAVYYRRFGSNAWIFLINPGGTATSYQVTGLSGNTMYEFISHGNVTQSWSETRACRTLPTPLSPPVNYPPSGLTASAASASAINIYWTNASAQATELQYSTDNGGSWGVLTSPASGVTSYQHTGLSAGATVLYRIRHNNSGTYSSFTNTVSATTQAPPPSGSAPHSCTATPTGYYSIQVAFQNPGDDARIEYSVNPDMSSAASTSWGVGSPTTISSLAEGTTYYFRVQNGFGYSNIASASTYIYVPPDPDPYCVVYATMIDTVLENGEWGKVRALDIRSGMLVRSIETRTGEAVVGMVKAVHRGVTSRVRTILTTSGYALSCSPSHPVIRHLYDTTGGAARTFLVGDSILVYNDDLQRCVVEQVISIEDLDIDTPVLTLELTNDEHTFVSDGIVSHNIRNKSAL